MTKWRQRPPEPPAPPPVPEDGAPDQSPDALDPEMLARLYAPRRNSGMAADSAKRQIYRQAKKAVKREIREVHARKRAASGYTDEVAKEGSKFPMQPTPGQRRHVQLMAGFGIPHAHIAKILGMGLHTLRIHFADQLALGRDQTIAEVASSLVRQALGRARVVHVLEDGTKKVVEEQVAPNVQAAMFYLKTQAGWTETQKLETKDTTDKRPVLVIPQRADDMNAWTRQASGYMDEMGKIIGKLRAQNGD